MRAPVSARPRIWLTPAAAFALVLLGGWACSEPTKARQVASVVVSSPIGTRLAVGRTAQLSATALDGSGSPIAGVKMTWSSSAPGVAEVSATGLVSGRAEGAATITAAAQRAAGTFAHQVVAADLAGARTLLADPFARALLGALTAAPKTALEAALAECGVGLDLGNFDMMEAALGAMRTAITAASEPSDRALSANFALFVDHASHLLRL